MTKAADKQPVRDTHHDSFRLERRYPASPARVYAAWTTAAKARWFRGPHGWVENLREQDARVGGLERVHGRHANGWTSAFEARYFDLVPNARVVLCYDMYVNDQKISVTLATAEMIPDGDGTLLVYTEQSVFLNGHVDGGMREQGTRGLLEQLAEALATQ